MDQRKGLGTPGAGLGVKLVTLLIILLLFPSCSPSNKADEELRGEIKDLKKEVKALGEKLDKLEVSQQALLMVLKKPAALPPEAVAPPPQPPQFQAARRAGASDGQPAPGRQGPIPGRPGDGQRGGGAGAG